MVRMMEGVITHGTGTRAAFGRPAAGKTGTTQNWRDAWFIGFTPDWVCGVWIGNDDNAPMNKIVGGAIPAEIWRKMMLAAHQTLPVRDFPWLPPEPAAPESDGQVAVADHPGDDAGGMETDQTAPDQTGGVDQSVPDQGGGREDGVGDGQADAPPDPSPDADSDRAPRYQHAAPNESPYPDPDYPPPWRAPPPRYPQQPYETGPER